MSESRRGIAYGIAAYGMWGFVPLYWRLMHDVPPVEILAHRVVWGVIALAVIVWGAGAIPAVWAALRDRKTLAVMALSGTLLAINWGTFIGAVATDHLLDVSLGYFMNPLVSVALGTLVLGERLRRLQWIAIGSAAAGVVILTWRAGQVPWISVALALSFGTYGLVRKVARVASLPGSTVETALLTPIAAIYLAVLAARGDGELGHASAVAQLLLLSTGVVTVAPLLLFSSAARRLPLSTIGFLQYIAPTCQFVLATLVFHEPFTRDRLIAFGFIWLGLAVFSIDLVSRSRPDAGAIDAALRADQPNRPVM